MLHGSRLPSHRTNPAITTPYFDPYDKSVRRLHLVICTLLSNIIANLIKSLTANRKLLKANPPLTLVTGDHHSVQCVKVGLLTKTPIRIAMTNMKMSITQ
uniref:SFRICE_019224 n=1 Tax=Spodoptera frugiperda TaxID=7108 RepID=A0A2H1VPQ7_SPOFR